MDVVVLGAGAAGLMCAIEAGKRGRSVLVIEHAPKPAEKIRISGGGRCNFTNLYTSPANYISRNPRFCVSALSRYGPADFIALVEKHRIAYHEKTLGQLFCDLSSSLIVNMLLEECRAAHVEIRLQSSILDVRSENGRFSLRTASDNFECESLIVSTGGLSVPKMGATGFGYEIARQFGLGIVPTAPALVPFTFSESQAQNWQDMAGVAVPAIAHCGKASFRENILFTHRGVSGPAMLQISSYWRPGETVCVNLSPQREVGSLLLDAKRSKVSQSPVTLLATILPKRLAQKLAMELLPRAGTLNNIPDRDLKSLAAFIEQWQFKPGGTEGYRTAEVTSGGVDTAELSSQSMQSRRVPGLYFIGEVVDVTGQLGGYNFQWAWSSGFAAGQYC